jgi:glycosyltransferase involved in cell wall biosynthesis
VARDFHHFEEWILPGGYVAFHDYADYFPGVRSFVDELLAESQYRKIGLAKSLIVLRKNVARVEVAAERAAGPAIHIAQPIPRPMVSCVMPTADRRPFLPQAIGHFLKQDYPARELIIVDDGLDNVADLIPKHESIRYLRLPERRSMGSKHNLACEMACGDVIVHLDDDDWNAAWRVSYQVESLLRHPEKGICGLSRMLFYEPESRRGWKYVYPANGRPWVYGATFCYRKAFWQGHRFPDMNEGADTTYVWNLDGTPVLPLENHRFFVATVHARNTSPKRTQTSGWQPRSSAEIRSVLDDAGWSFYEQLCRGQESRII